MSWPSVTVRLKASNVATGTPSVPIDVYCYTEGGYGVPEQLDQEPYAGGYIPNGSVAGADRRQFDLVVRTFTVGASTYSQADYELLRKYLRARYLWIESVTYDGGTHPRVFIGDVPFWTSGNAMVLPAEVYSKISVEDLRSEFRVTLTLTDARPTVGVTI